MYLTLPTLLRNSNIPTLHTFDYFTLQRPSALETGLRNIGWEERGGEGCRNTFMFENCTSICSSCTWFCAFIQSLPFLNTLTYIFLFIYLFRLLWWCGDQWLNLCSFHGYSVSQIIDKIHKYILSIHPGKIIYNKTWRGQWTRSKKKIFTILYIFLLNEIVNNKVCPL